MSTSENKKESKASRAEKTIIALIYRDPTLLSMVKDKKLTTYFSEESDKNIFEKLIQKINAESSTAIDLSTELLPEEYSRFCGIISGEVVFEDEKKAILDLEETLKFEYERRLKDIEQDGEEMEKWLLAMKTKKTGEGRGKNS